MTSQGTILIIFTLHFEYVSFSYLTKTSEVRRKAKLPDFFKTIFHVESFVCNLIIA